jgi:hypothetical protein
MDVTATIAAQSSLRVRGELVVDRLSRGACWDAAGSVSVSGVSYVFFRIKRTQNSGEYCPNLRRKGIGRRESRLVRSQPKGRCPELMPRFRRARHASIPGTCDRSQGASGARRGPPEVRRSTLPWHRHKVPRPRCHLRAAASKFLLSMCANRCGCPGVASRRASTAPAFPGGHRAFGRGVPATPPPNSTVHPARCANTGVAALSTAHTTSGAVRFTFTSTLRSLSSVESAGSDLRHRCKEVVPEDLPLLRSANVTTITAITAAVSPQISPVISHPPLLCTPPLTVEVRYFALPSADLRRRHTAATRCRCPGPIPPRECRRTRRTGP